MTNERHVGVIDQGTTGTRFVVFDEAGEPIGNGFIRHDRRLEPPHHVEYDPAELWQCTRAAIQEGLTRAPVGAKDLDALGIANQRQTTVVWEEDTGRPIGPAIGWQDRRANDIIRRLGSDHRQVISKRTGLIPDPYFAGPKLAWQLKNGGESFRKRAEAGDIRFGTIDSWLVWKLTGNHLTDSTNAAQSMFFDIRNRSWDDQLLSIFDVPRAMLPEVAASSDPRAYGETDVSGLLDTSIPVTGVLGNQQAALVAQGDFDLGATKVSYGSGNFPLQNIGFEPIKESYPALCTIWFQEAGEEPYYGLEGPVLATGTVIEWLETLGLVEDSEIVHPGGSQSDQSRPPTFLPSVSGAGAPSWNLDAAGAIMGLTRHTSSADIVRAAVEGVGFATRASLDEIDRISENPPDYIYVDGGPVEDDNFARHQATLLGRTLGRSKFLQTAARGAAFAAGLAVGIWDSPEQISKLSQSRRTFHPNPEDESVSDRYQSWWDIVSRVGEIGNIDQ